MKIYLVDFNRESKLYFPQLSIYIDYFPFFFFFFFFLHFYYHFIRLKEQFLYIYIKNWFLENSSNDFDENHGLRGFGVDKLINLSEFHLRESLI